MRREDVSAPTPGEFLQPANRSPATPATPCAAFPLPAPTPPLIPQARCSSGLAEQGFNALLNEMATGPAVCTPLLPEITPGTLIRLQEFSAAPSLAGARPTLRLLCGHEKQAHSFLLLSLLSDAVRRLCCHKTPSALSGAPFLFIYFFTLLLMSPIF